MLYCGKKIGLTSWYGKYPIIYRVLYILGSSSPDFWTINSMYSYVVRKLLAIIWGSDELRIVGFLTNFLSLLRREICCCLLLLFYRKYWNSHLLIFQFPTNPWTLQCKSLTLFFAVFFFGSPDPRTPTSDLRFLLILRVETFSWSRPCFLDDWIAKMWWIWGLKLWSETTPPRDPITYRNWDPGFMVSLNTYCVSFRWWRTPNDHLTFGKSLGSL